MVVRVLYYSRAAADRAVGHEPTLAEGVETPFPSLRPATMRPQRRGLASPATGHGLRERTLLEPGGADLAQKQLAQQRARSVTPERERCAPTRPREHPCPWRGLENNRAQPEG